MNKSLIALAMVLALSACSKHKVPEASIYKEYLPEAQKIYSQMTLDQKIGQLLQPSYNLLANAVSKNGVACNRALNEAKTSDEALIQACGLDQIAKFHLGAVLMGGGPYFNAPTLANWQKLNALATHVHDESMPYDPVFLIGNDAVHGNMHVQGAVLFPHNIGLGVSHDAQLVEKIAYLTAEDSLKSGFNWVFAPMVGVAQDIRWGRTYESFGQTPSLVKALSEAYVKGAEDIRNQHIEGVLATAKHYIGDGATEYGMDEGDDQYQGSRENFWQENGAGFEGALNADVGSIMVSYSAINGDNTRMHFGGRWNSLNQLKGAGIAGADNKLYEFDGLTVSDWNGVSRAAYFYDQINQLTLSLREMFARSFNSGVDVFMLGQGDRISLFDVKSPGNYKDVADVFNALKTAYQSGLISDQRLHDALIRILSVKLAMAKPPVAIDYPELQAQERVVALEAAEESLVLLKNEENTLPIKKAEIKNVIFIGPANDLGLQNGGWSVRWQGQKGNQYFVGKNKQSSGAMTLLDGIKNELQGQKVNYYFVDIDQVNLPKNLNPKSTLLIAVLAEAPYAEYMGDIANANVKDNWYEAGVENDENPYMHLPQKNTLALQWSTLQEKSIARLKKAGVKVITVVYSGRPVILTAGGERAPWDESDALIAAFLPGTLGGKALANAIFGSYHFRNVNNTESNTLTFPWPSDETQVENRFKDHALFNIGYGLKD